MSRPNRFIALVEISGREEVCHIKNTGRCKELLLKGVRVILSVSDKSSRKTKFDLVAVYKNGLLINMDSQSPNKVALEWLSDGGEEGFSLLRPEYTIGDSRFDFYGERNGIPAVIEVKGVTLEENGTAQFPDAPTQRGVKHLKGLIELSAKGYDTAVFFVVQMSGMKCFEPNRTTDPLFADTLSEAYNKGVRIICRGCNVTPDSMCINNEEIPIKLI